MTTNCDTLTCRFELYWGKKIPNQEMLNRDYFSLYGETPERNDIHAVNNIMNTVVYDGRCWRELDLAAMEKARDYLH